MAYFKVKCAKLDLLIQEKSCAIQSDENDAIPPEHCTNFSFSNCELMPIKTHNKVKRYHSHGETELQN